VVKEALSAAWAIGALLLLAILLMIAIRIYKRFRLKK